VQTRLQLVTGQRLKLAQLPLLRDDDSLHVTQAIHGAASRLGARLLDGSLALRLGRLPVL